MSLIVFGYLNGGAETKQYGANVGTVDVWDCSEQRLTIARDQLKAMRAAGMGALVNLHRVCWHTQWDDGEDRLVNQRELEWTARLDIGALDRLEMMLSAYGLWSTVVAWQTMDEPFTRFVIVGRPLGRGAEHLRQVNRYVKGRWPNILIYQNFGAGELVDGRLETMPQPSQDVYGADVVGFDVYSDAGAFGDTRNGSYRGLLKRAKELFPGHPIVPIIDGVMYPTDTIASKIARINDIYAIAQADPYVAGLLVYRWGDPAPCVSTVPELLAHYTRIGLDISRA